MFTFLSAPWWSKPACGRSLRLATVSLLSALLLSTVAAAGNRRGCSSQSCCCSAPEVWVINTRCVPRCNNLDYGFEKISYQRYDRCRGCFVKETRESFLAQEASMPTMFFIHGNTLKHKGAMKELWEVSDKLCCCPGPKRLVLWSWPAERVIKMKGLRFREMIEKNLMLKYAYSEYQGYYLAKLVQQMSLSQRVTLAGHSYGAITSSAALHLLAGGCLRGMRLEGGMPVERHNLRLAHISAAFDCDMLYPGHRYGMAFVAAEKVFTTYNPHDKTLKKWPKHSWRGCQALGCVGMSGRPLGVNRHKLYQMCTYPENRRSHYLGPHLKNQRFVSALCCVAFGGTRTAAPPVAGEEVVISEKPVQAESEPTVAEPAKEQPTPAPSASEAKTPDPAPAVETPAADPAPEPVVEKVEPKESRKTAPSRSRTSYLRRNGVFRTRR